MVGVKAAAQASPTPPGRRTALPGEILPFPGGNVRPPGMEEPHSRGRAAFPRGTHLPLPGENGDDEAQSEPQHHDDVNSQDRQPERAPLKRAVLISCHSTVKHVKWVCTLCDQ